MFNSDSPIALYTVTIPDGATGIMVNGLRLNGKVPVAIIMPATWATAALTFQFSFDNETYYNVYSSGSEYSVAGDDAQCVVLDYTKFLGVNYIKIRSGTASSPVNQTANRTLQVLAR